MKVATLLSGLSLLTAGAALLISVRSSTAADAAVDRRIDEALVRREKAYVQQLTPKMEQIYRDMLPKYTPPPKPPETFAELFAPAVQVVSGMSGASPAP